MFKIKVFIFLMFIMTNGKSQTMLDYLSNKDLQTLENDYNYDEERIIDSLLNFSLSMGDTTTTVYMWYNNLTAIRNFKTPSVLSTFSVYHKPSDKEDPKPNPQ